jgi:hypothetical protein
MMGANDRVPVVPMMHACCVREPAQADQNAQGQNRTHRFFLRSVRSICSIITTRQRSNVSFLASPYSDVRQSVGKIRQQKRER